MILKSNGDAPPCLNCKIICVDLDGTFIKNDVTILSIKRFIQKCPWNILKLIFWLLKSKVYMKHRIAQEIEIDPAELDYNKILETYLEYKRTEGYKIYLATASHEKYAQSVVQYKKIFEGVFASNKFIDLKAQKKAETLEKEFGMRGFIYAGNSKADIPVWQASAFIIAVSPTKSLKKFLEKHEFELIGDYI